MNLNGVFLILIASLIPILTARADDEVKGVHWGVMPVSKFSTDQGISLGAFARRFDYGEPAERPFKTLLTFQTSYSTRGPRGGFASYEKTGFAGTDFRFYSEVYAFTNPYENYFGTGDSTSYSRELDQNGFNHYTLEGIAFRNSLRRHLTDGLDLEAGIAVPYLRQVPHSADTLFSQEFGNAPIRGLSARLEFKAILDRRNSEFIPSRGYLADASLTLGPGFLGADSTWQRGELDFRLLVPLIEPRWLTFANQVKWEESSPGTPITDKVKLGSAGTLRGLPYGRYRSNHAFSLRSELRTLFIRWTLFGLPLKGGLGIFGDTGKIGDTLPRMVTNPLQTAWGMTFFGSYFTDDFLGSADIGFSRDGAAVYIGLGHSI